MQKDQIRITDKVAISNKKVIADQITFKCHLHIVTYRPSGKIKSQRHVYNTVTATGKEGVADQLLAAPTLGKPTHMAIGTGTPAANALGAEVARVAFGSKTRSGAVVTMVGTFPAGTGTGAITEASTQDAGSGGNTYMTASFAVVNKGALDATTVTWTLTVN